MIPIDHTSTAASAACVHAGEALHVARDAPDSSLEVGEGLALELVEQLVEPDGVVADEGAVDAALGEQHLEHAVDERDVAAGVDGEELVGHLRAEHRALDVARHPVALEAGLAQRVDDGDLRAALAGEVQVLHEDGLRVGDVRAEQHDQVAVDDVGVRARRGADADASRFSATVDGAWHTRAALSMLALPRKRVTFCAT